MIGEFRDHDTCCPPTKPDWVGRFIDWVDAYVWALRIALIVVPAYVAACWYGNATKERREAAMADDRGRLDTQLGEFAEAVGMVGLACYRHEEESGTCVGAIAGRVSRIRCYRSYDAPWDHRAPGTMTPAGCQFVLEPVVVRE